ncbi:hypothetical protein CU669_05195 [Paramagnetospirillum kuznetsovii]|uniref:Uncharacterized protein n=1 Tax=Paramagnetospirillum kuznetsovii TaxID=2053833 RepID=A0A364P0B9_9PROT|nr:hypothetical protein [Paramagnetospirillum kuznetsovii]RAU22788.1 hypothetical protein CU669_05195 [Paramagnetospirillum kuznetsovii]
MSTASIADKAQLPPIQPIRQTAPVVRDADGDKDKEGAEQAAEANKPSSEPLPLDPNKGRNLNITV